MTVPIIIIVILTAFVFVVRYFSSRKYTVAQFIRNHPDKSAIYLKRNNSPIIRVNPHKMMPLASTFKIVIAIEYAEQVYDGSIEPDELVDLSDVELFYVPHTDGGAHHEWRKSINNESKQISMHEIAKGLISHSSNANTEWLMERLGLVNINKRLKSLHVNDHDEIYYLVSSIFVGKEAFLNRQGNELVEKLRKMDMRDYIQMTYIIHDKLRCEPEYKNELGDFGMDVQKVWSDRLPGSTVSEYIEILDKINSRSYFNETTQKYLDDVMKPILDNPVNKTWLKHAGMKGGSTAFTLTKALYVTDKEGTKTELAYFLNGLTPYQKYRLLLSMNDFELALIRDKKFCDEIGNFLVRL